MTDRRCQRDSAFTLTEILVTITVIVIIMAVAVPLFRFLTGTRSVEAAQGHVAAMMSQARAMALNSKQYTGVAFFYDVKSERTTMALVYRALGNGGDMDPLDNYKGWVTGPGLAYLGSIDPNTPPPPPPGQRVIFMTQDTDEKRMLVRRYQRTNRDPSYTQSPPVTNPPDHDDYWMVPTGGNLELVPGTDFQLLPQGVGAQLVNGPGGPDRYMRVGVILFDTQGRVDSVSCAVSAASNLGIAMHLSADLVPSPTWYSQFGVALYDLSVFRSQPGFSDGDGLFTLPAVPGPAGNADEQREETWLDQNATIYMVGRTNGVLIKGE